MSGDEPLHLGRLRMTLNQWLESTIRERAENRRLRDRIVELEAELALLRGTPGSSPTSETLTEYTHDVPPDAPR